MKTLQRYIIAKKLNKLRVHPIATAYKSGLGIQSNRARHRKNRVILKLDFKDFFHSITYPDLLATLNAANYDAIDKVEWGLLKQILFWPNPSTNSLCLSIGAPSSPFLSNVIMARIDESIAGTCETHGVTCTRYADDITLSTNSIERLVAAETDIRKIISRTRRPTLTFNDQKRGIFTTAGRRIITGLVLTPEGKVSLGRDRKREISAAIHHVETQQNLAQEHLLGTRGWLAYAKGVEPTFFVAMQKKYPATVEMLMHLSFGGDSV